RTGGTPRRRHPAPPGQQQRGAAVTRGGARLMAYNPAAKPNRAKIADEQAAVLELRRNGYTVRQIAAQLGISKSTVQNRLDAAIAELVEPAAREVRLLELERLDARQARLEGKLDDGEDPAKVVPIALKVQERRAKLLGLDA